MPRNQSYELHFAKGDLPPNKAFWSLTMYDGKSQLLVANPLKRYLLNSTNLSLLQVRPRRLAHPLRLPRQTPASKESNWLPAPDGPFYCILRVYLPGEAVLNGIGRNRKCSPFQAVLSRLGVARRPREARLPQSFRGRLDVSD